MTTTPRESAAPSAHKFRKWVLRSPPAEWAISKLRDVLIGALRQGPVPRHVAFVMDGNRRFARNNHIETIEGHNLGFEALARILEVCYKAGVEVVTIYAFSIENFKRSKYEVDALMDMAKVKLSQLAQHGEVLDRYGACIRILGKKEMFREDVLKAVNQAVELTKHNTRAVLNVCCPYTSREEITTAVRTTVAEYSQPLQSSTTRRPFSESSITRNLRSRHLGTLREESTSRSPTPDPSSREKETSSTTEPPTTLRSNSASPFSSSTTLNHDSTSPSNQESPSLTPADINAIPPLEPNIQEVTNADGDNDNSKEASDQLAPPESNSPSYPDPETITESTLNSHLFTAGSPPLDLLVRTSGVERLSDFMLWQCHEHTSIVFLKCLWPEFDLWHFLPVLVEWQWWASRRAEGGVEGDGSSEKAALKQA